MSTRNHVFIKILFGALFIVSILASYYTYVVQGDYEVLTNEDGLPIIEEEE